MMDNHIPANGKDFLYHTSVTYHDIYPRTELAPQQVSDSVIRNKDPKGNQPVSFREYVDVLHTLEEDAYPGRISNRGFAEPQSEGTKGYRISQWIESVPLESICKTDERVPLSFSQRFTEPENDKLDRTAYRLAKRRLDFHMIGESPEHKRFADSKPSPKEKTPVLERSTLNRNLSEGQVRKLPGVKRRLSFTEDDNSSIESRLAESRDFSYLNHSKYNGHGSLSPTGATCDTVCEHAEGGRYQSRRIRVAPPREVNQHMEIQIVDRKQLRLIRFKDQLEQLEQINPTRVKLAETRRYVPCTDVTSNTLQQETRCQTGSSVSSNVDQRNRKRRPIIIDGSNVAYGRSNGKFFDSQGVKVCVEYFIKKGFTDITVVVPEIRLKTRGCRDPDILRDLKDKGLLITSWSKKMSNGQWVASYDDRMILEIAHKRGGIIISNDRYRDLLKENPEWKETILERVLGFRFMPGRPDEIMFPVDPFGRFGPRLEDFLRF